SKVLGWRSVPFQRDFVTLQRSAERDPFRDGPSRMGGTVVSSWGAPLSLVMKLVALIALDLAFLRVQPSRLLQSPPFLFALVALDVITIQFFILGRRLGPFHHAFLIIGLVASLALHTFFHDGVFHGITGTPTNRPSPGSLIADRYITSTLGLLLAWSASLRA